LAISFSYCFSGKLEQIFGTHGARWVTYLKRDMEKKHATLFEEKYSNLSGHNNSHKLEQIFGTIL
jgi:hypothetical protein